MAKEHDFMPLYRLTFENEHGETSECDVDAPNLPAAFLYQGDLSHLIKIERINRMTGNVMEECATSMKQPTES